MKTCAAKECGACKSGHVWGDLKIGRQNRSGRIVSFQTDQMRSRGIQDNRADSGTACDCLAIIGAVSDGKTQAGVEALVDIS